MTKQEDLRCTKTKSKLKRALIELLKTTDMDHISVKALCDASGVNRSTFYSHYHEVEEVYSDIEHELIEKADTITNFVKKNKLSFSKTILGLITFIDEYTDIYEILLKYQSEELYEMNKQTLVSYWKEDPENPASIYTMEFLLAGAHRVLHLWIKGGKKESKEQVAALLYTMMKDHIPVEDTLSQDIKA